MATDQNQSKSAMDIEKEQEALLAKKYGGVLKRKQPLMPRGHHAYFDSADWALAKEGKGEQPSVAAEESLPPRTSPAITAHRAASKMEGSLVDAPAPPAPGQ